MKGRTRKQEEEKAGTEETENQKEWGEGTEITLFEVWDFTGGAFCEWLQVPPKLC